MPVYQVCECTTVGTAAGPAKALFTIARSADSVVRAALAPASSGSGWATKASLRCTPMQWTSTSHSFVSCPTSSVTCTPAPP